MHEPDPDLGWRSKEGRYVFGTTPIRMTFWPDHTRATAAAPVRADAAVVVLGCSFVQGWALSDEETFAWKLQERFARAGAQSRDRRLRHHAVAACARTLP